MRLKLPITSAIALCIPLLPAWSQVCPGPGDLNRDVIVDHSDFQLLLTCLAGPGITAPPECPLERIGWADLQNDGDVDVPDLATLMLLAGQLYCHCHDQAVPRAQEIAIDGIPPVAGNVGVFDPSAASSETEHFLAFSRIRFLDDGTFPPRTTADIMIAQRVGDAWHYMATAAEAITTEDGEPGPLGDVRTQHETPSLVYDPWDPDPQRRWKLFWLLLYQERRAVEPVTDWHNLCNIVAYKAAPTPAGLASAPLHQAITITDFSVFPPPLSTYCVAEHDINVIHDQGSQVFFGVFEPGILAGPDGLTMVLDGWGFEFSFNELFTIVSNDHAHSWNFQATQVTTADAAARGDLYYTAGTVDEDVDRSGTVRQFLLTSPVVDPAPEPAPSYRGVLAFELVDGQVQRDGLGQPIVYRHILNLFNEDVGGGQSSYDLGLAGEGGLFMAQWIRIILPGFGRAAIFSVADRLIPRYHRVLPATTYYGHGVSWATESCDTAAFAIDVPGADDIVGTDVQLTFTLYDMDTTDEVHLFINGTSIPLSYSVADEGFSQACVMVPAALLRQGIDMAYFESQAFPDSYAVGAIEVTAGGVCP